MRIALRCFSHLRHVLKTDRLQLDLPAGSTSATVEAIVRERLGDLRELVWRVAVNHEIVGAPTALQDGDEVALLPPMQGG